MARLRRASVVGIAVVAASAVTVPMAYGADPRGAAKRALVGPEAVLWCTDLTPTYFENATQVVDGFAIFNASTESGHLGATFSLKGAEPNTEYVVRLLQGDWTGEDCHTQDAVLKTNDQGNGTIHINEALRPETFVAQVIIDTRWLYGYPSYRATEPYYISK